MVSRDLNVDGDLNIDAAGKNRRGRTREPERLARPPPRYRRRAAGQIDPHVRLKKSLPPADGGRRAGARAAGQGLADPPLEHTQADAATIDNLHESHVGAPWKAAMEVDERAELLHGRALHIGDAQHGVRIT